MMYCPKCYTDDLSQVNSGSLPDATFVCASCEGIWMMNVEAVTDLRKEPDELPEHDRERDLRAGLCPFGHGILRRAQTHLDPPFYLERCGICSGIWFDRGEWERVVVQGLSADLGEIWTQSWQQRKLDEERRRRTLNEAQQALGAEIVEELFSLGGKLRDHHERNRAIAFLLEVVRGGLDREGS